ncbi:MAG: 50S ribosomal protein L6 [Parcubacteria group bacterium RIFOXYD2_FULL_52_8]|nr:ribosomal protein L6 [uncultured bacterium]OHB24353.1 MAG: 50S ribosomal protein L6 [Parcubacteria group bacterium RIFOXYD2_FULL_52_8]
MSRVGKQRIQIPEKVTVTTTGDLLTVKGPLGEVTRKLHKHITLRIEDGVVLVEPTVTTLESRALWGTFASHVINMIEGVTKGFVKKLIIEGVGYKAEVQGEKINFALGFSHPVPVMIPQGLKVVHEKGTLTITGIDKESVGQFASQIVARKRPEPYKGKGIRYDGQVVRRKQGKKTVS